MIRLNYFAVAIFTLSIILLATWYQWRDHFTDTPDATITSIQPDYTIETFQSQVFTESGQLHYEMKSLTLAHYPQNDTLEMQKPWIKLYEGEGAPWVIEADKGQSPSRDEIFLSGNVKINGTVGNDHNSANKPLFLEDTLEQEKPNEPFSQAQRKQIKMETETLALQINNEFAETHDPVIIFSDNDQIESIGLEADLRNDVLLLQSNVKGTYTVE